MQLDFLRTKSVALLRNETKTHALSKSLGALDVMLLGVGVIIGTGIFVLTGVAAAEHAGPALMLSFVIASLTCGFVSLVYSEMAAMLPVAGSAYTYTYASLGEFPAWLVGWNLILEYSVGASAVAGGWSAYMTELLKAGGVALPPALTSVPAEGGIVNLPAVLVTLLLTCLLVRGVRESVTVNKLLVGVKFFAIFLFLLLAGPHVDAANWRPFMPFGFAGVSAGAAVIFFAYLGVDSVATAAEETKNPNRDMPLGIIGSLLVCTALYVAVAGVMTGVVSYQELNTAEPVTYVLRSIGYRFGSAVVGTGAVAGLTTVLLVMMYAQSRAFFAMARDGLIPKRFCKVHARYQTPYAITIVVGAGVALISGFTPIGVVAEMCSIGTLFAFIASVIGVVVMRRSYPALARPFRCPSVHLVAAFAIASCAYIMCSLSALTWLRFVLWSVLGTAIYFAWGRAHSALQKPSYSSSVSKESEIE